MSISTLFTATLYSFIEVLCKGNIVTLIQAYFERHVGPCKTKIDPDLGPNTVLISLFDILFRIHSFLLLSPFHLDPPSLQTGLAVIYKIDFFPDPIIMLLYHGTFRKCGSGQLNNICKKTLVLLK